MLLSMEGSQGRLEYPMSIPILTSIIEDVQSQLHTKTSTLSVSTINYVINKQTLKAEQNAAEQDLHTIKRSKRNTNYLVWQGMITLLCYIYSYAKLEKSF